MFSVLGEQFHNSIFAFQGHILQETFLLPLFTYTHTDIHTTSVEANSDCKHAVQNT